MRPCSHFHKALGAVLFIVWLAFGYGHTAIAQAQQGIDGTSTVPVMSNDDVRPDESLPPYTMTPVVANEKAKPRDILKKELVLTNNRAQKVSLYLTVEDIDPQKGEEAYGGPLGSDLSTSLASWVEITRGVIELEGGESRKIPYLIHVNLTAKPGSYFVNIRAREGSTRAEAEARTDGSMLTLNLEVLDDAKERLQLGTFKSDDSVIFGDNVSFSYLLENTGNRDVEPRGSIRIFNRKGEEVGSVPLNADGVKITPENKEQLAALWSAGNRFGKYKAFLDLEYGENQLASVQDTVYFWVFPWKEILASLFGVIVLAVIGTFIVHMRAVATPRPAFQTMQRFPPVSGTSDGQPVRTGGLVNRNAIVHRTNATARSTTTAPTAPQLRTNHGATVALAPRRGATVSGSTVTLAPRR